MRTLLSLLLLAIWALGCSLPSRSSMSIRAVRPTGDTWYTPHPQPIWTFAITNTGSIKVQWRSGIEVKGGEDKEYSHAGGFVNRPEGILPPGQGVRTNMIVPALTGAVWRAYVEFWPPASSEDFRTQSDEWH